MIATPATSPDAAVRAYVALGGNLGDRRARLEAGFTALAALPGTRLAARSAFYETAPLGPAGQQDYYNAVAALDTTLPPLDLLESLLTIERANGRERRERWGPRTLDLDLLLHGDSVLRHPRLTLPHPAMRNRAFVLVPLLEVAPDLIIAGHAARELLASLDRTGVRRLNDTPAPSST